MRLLLCLILAAGAAFAQRMAPTFTDLQTFIDVCPQNDPYYATIRRDFLITRDGVEAPDPVCVEPYTRTPVAQVTEELAWLQVLRFAYYMDMGRANYLPWTPLRLYDWMRARVGGININTLISPGSVAAACCSAVNGRLTIQSSLISNDNNRQFRLTAEGLASNVALLAHETRHLDGNGYGHTGCCIAGTGACDPSYSEGDLSAYGVQYWLFREWANGGINLGYSCNANIARALAANLINSANVYPSRFCSAPPPTLTSPATPGGACIAACSVNVNGTPPATSSSAGTSFSLAVSTSTPACGWTVASPSNWIGVLPTTSAAGSGSFTVNVAPNLGAARSGSFVVGGTKFTITEAAASCAPNCSVPSDTTMRLGRGFLSVAPANNFVPWPLTVELFNGSGAPLGGVPVTFTTTNATTTPTTVTTDERGRAPVTVKLGATNGAARVTASVPGLAPLNVNLAAVPASSYISSVTTAWGGYTIAQNTFIEIKGTSLVPADTPASGVIWSSAPEFAQGRMPTTLGGISVTVNGKPAFIYFYCSRNTTTACATDQINVLTPLDTATGPVDVVVTNKGVSTPAFSVEMKAVAPTFLLYGPQGYVIATHANYSYLGPTTLFPGASTPAKVGETVVTYAVGFGLPTATLVNGSSTQSGLLPEAPVCTVNRINAPTSAALIAPGLYQLNITVPSGVRNGDNALDCSYRGASTFAGGLLAVAVP